jgi:hypothetical protein
MQVRRSEMAGISGDLGPIWEIGLVLKLRFFRERLSRYICHVAGDSFVSVSLIQQTTLELILNIVWASIAATLLLFWSRPHLTRADARRSGIALLALLCVICILFPVVSMTDDLNASPAEPETVKSQLAMAAPFLLISGLWMLVYDPNASPFHHEIATQEDFGPPSHAFLSFFLTRRPPPPQTA